MKKNIFIISSIYTKGIITFFHAAVNIAKCAKHISGKAAKTCIARLVVNIIIYVNIKIGKLMF